MIQTVDLILQDEIVPCLKARQHPVDLRVGDLLIAAAEEQDAVLPGGVHLNDGMAAGAVAYGHKVRVHPALPQDIRQNGAVSADLSGVADRSPGPCGGDGLVQPLAPQWTVRLVELRVSPPARSEAPDIQDPDSEIHS